MKYVNFIRSREIEAITDFIDELENGTGGDFDGFDYWEIKDHQKFRGQLNSYRAQQIANFFGKNINKQKLIKYSKPRDYKYSLTNKEIHEWLNTYKISIYQYMDLAIKVSTKHERRLNKKLLKLIDR